MDEADEWLNVDSSVYKKSPDILVPVDSELGKILSSIDGSSDLSNTKIRDIIRVFCINNNAKKFIGKLVAVWNDDNIVYYGILRSLRTSKGVCTFFINGNPTSFINIKYIGEPIIPETSSSNRKVLSK